MAVYTHLSAEQLAALIETYDVGELTSVKGIAEGVSNSNWLVETSGSSQGHGTQFILTMYERRIDTAELPYFLGLLDHLSAKGCPVPATIHDRDGAASRVIDGKSVALIEFLPGVSPSEPTPAQTRSVGEALAGMHLASQDYPLTRANQMGLSDTLRSLEGCTAERLKTIHADLPSVLEPARALAQLDTADLPSANIHADLFPDNVLMLGDTVSGMIDFYFACSDTMALDLATTHAAWCFDKAGQCLSGQSSALLDGYQSVRPLSAAEREALPAIAQGAALRFVASRAEDWLDTPDDALVTRKDPMDFVKRWKFYEQFGRSIFAG